MRDTSLGPKTFTFVHPGPITDSGLSQTITFYAAATAGGSPTTLNTVTILSGLITAWSQVIPGSGSGYLFDDADNSAYLAIW